MGKTVLAGLGMLLFVMAMAGCGAGPTTAQNEGKQHVTIAVFHADSLAGPLGQLKQAFEAKHADISVQLTSGRSKELADRILKGDVCDVFAPSDPAVVKDMFSKKVGAADAATWSITFSANEMVLITRKGNPLGIKQMSDLARAGTRLARVTGEKDLATGRTIEFIKKATAAEGQPDLGPKLIDTTAVKAGTIPEAVQALKDGTADAGVVYLSAAVAAGDAVDIVKFPANVNLSPNIRNALTVPGTAKQTAAALSFIRFILSADGQAILQKTGQPPLVPPVKDGSVPADIL